MAAARDSLVSLTMEQNQSMLPLDLLDQLSRSEARIDNIPLSLFGLGQGSIDMLREDLVFDAIPGNKLRKLMHNIRYVLHNDAMPILTFGGAYSNHIAAVAAAGHHFGIKTIGLIRGEELGDAVSVNPTLSRAKKQGMELHFLDRVTYRLKDQDDFQSVLRETYGPCYIIPEGGTNALAVQGCKEMMQSIRQDFDVMTLAVGTGGTMAGVLKGLADHQRAMGFSVLKGYDHRPLIARYSALDQCTLVGDHHFGGYAKITEELIEFINTFKERTQIALDPIYSGKMMFGLLKMLKNDNHLRSQRILALHSGGLQGIEGINIELARKGLPQIN